MTHLGISALCFTGHKSLLGPQGIGGICLAEDVIIPPLIVGGSGIKSFDPSQPKEMPSLLEAGTLNGHGIAGLHAALDYIANQGMGQLRMQEQELAGTFYKSINTIEGVKIYGDCSAMERCPIISLNIGDADAALVSFRLQ